ncbi:DUF5693 family protein [Flindersiella endophytica]
MRLRRYAAPAAGLACVLLLLLTLPALLPRVAAERTDRPVELAVPDSVLQTWKSPATELEAAGVSTVVIGMRYDDDNVPQGYDPQRLRAARAAGLRVVLALPNLVPPRTTGWLEGQVTQAVSATTARMVVTLGDPLPEGFERFLVERRLLLGLPDLSYPERADSYAEAMPGRIVRAHFLPLGPSSDLDSLNVRARRAEKERGVRFVLIQPPRPDVPVALDRATALARSIGEGQRIGAAAPMPAVDPPGPLGWLSPALVQLLALGIGVAGATAAVLLVLIRVSRSPGVLGFGLGVLCTLTTGLVVAALGSRSEFLVGAERYVGVKLLLLTPPALIALAGLWVNRRQLAKVRWRPWYVLIGGLVLLAGAYYVLRSGNSGVAPGVELRLRDALDETLYSRPRFKEAFLGYPALVLAAGLRSRWRWVFAVLAAVGTAGTVDTFAHFHTPLGVSLLRTGYALVVGVVLGLVALAVWRAVARRKEAAA